MDARAGACQYAVRYSLAAPNSWKKTKNAPDKRKASEARHRHDGKNIGITSKTAIWSGSSAVHGQVAIRSDDGENGQDEKEKDKK
jgi:hypothetical protein